MCRLLEERAGSGLGQRLRGQPRPRGSGSWRKGTQEKVILFLEQGFSLIVQLPSSLVYKSGDSQCPSGGFLGTSAAELVFAESLNLTHVHPRYLSPKQLFDQSRRESLLFSMCPFFSFNRHSTQPCSLPAEFSKWSGGLASAGVGEAYWLVSPL